MAHCSPESLNIGYRTWLYSSLSALLPIGTEVVSSTTGEVAYIADDKQLWFRGEAMPIAKAARIASGSAKWIDAWDSWQTRSGETLHQLWLERERAQIKQARSEFTFSAISRVVACGEGCSGDVDNTPETSGSVTAHFGDLAGPMCDFIDSADFIVGCVAWLTHFDVITSLARRPMGCQIIVQKEDFLRPDSNARGQWQKTLRRRYSSLTCKPSMYSLCPQSEGFLSSSSVCSCPAIRCVGNHNSDRNPAFPRMHHKFAVACKAKPKASDEDGGAFNCVPEPYAVWTGSFNATANGTRSRENAVVISDPAIATRYYAEWWSMLGLSEPLDWESAWMAPEYRIGT